MPCSPRTSPTPTRRTIGPRTWSSPISGLFSSGSRKVPRAVLLERTSGGHLAGLPGSASAPRRQQIDSFEVAPSGNAVLIEEQLRHLGNAERGYQLATSVYGKYVGLLRTAIGKRCLKRRPESQMESTS
jgi:flagellar basal-body rod protein FlgB